MSIMKISGVPEHIAYTALYGVPPTKSDNEMGEKWNWTSMYDDCMLRHSIRFADNYLTGKSKHTEVGLKYPKFNPALLIKKYNLKFVGTIETDWSKKYKVCEDKSFYDVWQSKDRTVNFSFLKGYMGKHGYASAHFPNPDAAIEFIKWFFNHKSFYIKNIDFINNGLGGLSRKEIKDGIKNLQEVKERKAYLKVLKTL